MARKAEPNNISVDDILNNPSIIGEWQNIKPKENSSSLQRLINKFVSERIATLMADKDEGTFSPKEITIPVRNAIKRCNDTLTTEKLFDSSKKNPVQKNNFDIAYQALTDFTVKENITQKQYSGDKNQNQYNSVESITIKRK